MVRQQKPLDEEFAREALHRYLCNFGELESLEWIPYERPDWLLKTPKMTIGVEVTRALRMMKLGKMPSSSRGIAVTTVRRAKSLASSLEKKGVLNGFYEVFTKPIENLDGRLSEIEEEIVHYIRQNADVKKAPYKPLPGRWRVQKLGVTPKRMVVSYGPGFKWEGEIQEEIKIVVAEAVERKANLLNELGLPTILALFDDYHLADDDMWEKALGSTASQAKAIVRVHGDYQCQVLRGTKFLQEFANIPESNP